MARSSSRWSGGPDERRRDLPHGGAGPPPHPVPRDADRPPPARRDGPPDLRGDDGRDARGRAGCRARSPRSGPRSPRGVIRMSVQLLLGDCRTILPTLPADSVHCVVTSPPYWGLRDYGVAGQLGLEPTPEEYVAHMVGVFREVRRVLRDDGTCWVNMGDSHAAHGGGGEGRMRELYPDAPERWRGIHTAAGHGQISGGGGKTFAGLKTKDLVGMPWRLAFALQADGWFLRADCIWAKPNPMPESVTDRPTKAHEYVFLLTKAARYFYDADAVREPHAEPWRGNGERDGGTARVTDR